MSEITESEERLARPLIRLAKLVGVGTSYLGMSHDYHEIDDDVLIEVLAALGIDASSESAQLIAIRRILNERYARLVAPTVLHIAGSEDRVLVNTGILDVPSASITLENGEPYQGTIEVGPGDGSQPTTWMVRSFRMRLWSFPPICRLVTIRCTSRSPTVCKTPL